jgi:hypothetical protein
MLTQKWLQQAFGENGHQYGVYLVLSNPLIRLRKWDKEVFLLCQLAWSRK